VIVNSEHIEVWTVRPDGRGTAPALAAGFFGLLVTRRPLALSRASRRILVAHREDSRGGAPRSNSRFEAPAALQATLSPDGKWLALPLLDGATANVWLIPTSGEPTIPVTDFAGRPTAITRQVSWSPDSREIFAAVAEQHVDVIALDGLL
jgi:hypothetical protein